jgi:hypothetical protein
MKQVIGLVLIAIAAISLVATLFGLSQIWLLRQPLAGEAVVAFDLMSETLDTTSAALVVASNTLLTASDTVTTVERISTSVSATLSTTRVTMVSFAGLMGKDMPASIDATRTALVSAQSSAVVVDNVLKLLSNVPFINVQYNPDVPLSASLGNVAKSLDSLPVTFGSSAVSLNGTAASLDQMNKSLVDVARTTSQLQVNITEAQVVVTRYQTEVSRLKSLAASVKSAIPSALASMEFAAAFLIFWLAAAQVQVLFKGLALLTGGRAER